MALEHAILVSLAEQSATGYDLARRFDASIGHFWPASHQQIYKVLGRMEAAGLLTVEHIAQDGRPDKKVYAVTDDGSAELVDWLATPTPREALRSEFAVKLRALHLADRDATIAAVSRRATEHTERLAYYERSRAQFYPDPATLPEDALGGYLVLRGGQISEQAGLDWCAEILDYLAER